MAFEGKEIKLLLLSHVALFSELSKITPSGVHRVSLRYKEHFGQSQKYRLGTEQTGKPPSLRTTRSSGGTSNSISRRTPNLRSIAGTRQLGFAHCMKTPFRLTNMDVGN